MKWAKRLILLALAAGAAYFVWTYFFPSPERVIRKRMNELAASASFQANEGELARVSNAGNLAGHFASQAEISVDVPGYRSQTIVGKDQIFQIAIAARARMQSLKVEFLDVQVRLGENRDKARVNLTAKANVPGERDFMVQELEFEVVKNGRTWLIQKAATVRTLH